MINKLFPILSMLDRWFADLLPLAIRLSVWGALAGILSIIIYAKISPQSSIAKLKKKTRALQREMLNVDLEFKDFLRISRENLKTSIRLFITVLGPALISAVPVIFFAIWIHTCLAYEAPPTRDDLVVKTEDSNIELRLFSNTDMKEISNNKIHDHKITKSGEIMVITNDKVIYSGTPLSPPTPVIHKERWWNFLLNSPAGYVVEDAPIDSIKFNVSKKRVIKWMPNWAKGWELPFFVFVLLAALGIKLYFRIE
jgi:hypothetical protein